MGKQHWKGGNMLNPVPAVMVSLQDKEGRPNIITVAWTGTVCTNPPMLSISVRPERFSYHMMEETGEFVVNLTTEELVKACDYCGVKSGRDLDKFKELGLTPLPMQEVSCPGIGESPVNIECKVVEVKPLGSHTLFLAEVVGVTVDEAFLDQKGRLALDSMGLIMYSHGEYYTMGQKVGSFGYSVRKKEKKK